MILEREAASAIAGPQRYPIAVEGQTVGWVEGDHGRSRRRRRARLRLRREADKRSLAGRRSIAIGS